MQVPIPWAELAIMLLKYTQFSHLIIKPLGQKCRSC
jgi:hypothetical protein